MQPFSHHYPKPLLPILNVPLIEHQFRFLADLGACRITIVIGHLGHEIAQTLGRKTAEGIPLEYVEQVDSLGIAHAVAQVEDVVSGPFVLLLGDIFFETAADFDLIDPDEHLDATPRPPRWHGVDRGFDLDRRILLDREGFRLLSHHSAIADFEGIELDPVANAKYMEELSALLSQEVGASQVMLLGGAKQRFSESATVKLAPLVNAKPARYPHGDNTDISSMELIKMFVETAAGLDMGMFPRYALYNLWRCVSPPPQDCPLAVCDAQSIAQTDEVPVTAVTMVHGIGEVRHDTTSYRYNPDHRWYYYPDMTRDELIIFKTHDPDKGRAKRVAHTAFDDPNCPAGATPRASVEARILALFQ